MISKTLLWKKEINSIKYRCYFVNGDIGCYFLTTDNGLHIRKDGMIDSKDIIYSSCEEYDIIDFVLGKLK